MVNRKYFLCSSCDTKFGCRTQLGSGREQRYLFPCPECGVEVGYTLFLYQDEGTWDYGEFHNLTDTEQELDDSTLLNFTSDFLCSREYLHGEMPMSPYFENMALVEDFHLYFELRNMRRNATEQFLPALNRADVHANRGDNDKFQKELKSIGADNLGSMKAGSSNTSKLINAFRLYSALFLPKSDPNTRLVVSRIREAWSVNPQHLEQLRIYYRNENRLDSLWGEVQSLHQKWAELYNFFEPLECIEHLRDPNQVLSDQYTLSQKPIGLLKAFYTDCFETLGRISVIAAAVEGVASGFGFGVPSNNGLIPVEEFELKPNGSKRHTLGTMPFWSVMEEVFDHKLRNSIGHHSWQYDAVSDIIHYSNNSPSRGREDFELRYLDFCIKTRASFHAILVMSHYLYAIFE